MASNSFQEEEQKAQERLKALDSLDAKLLESESQAVRWGFRQTAEWQTVDHVPTSARAEVGVAGGFSLSQRASLRRVQISVRQGEDLEGGAREEGDRAGCGPQGPLDGTGPFSHKRKWPTNRC